MIHEEMHSWLVNQFNNAQRKNKEHHINNQETQWVKASGAIVLTFVVPDDNKILLEAMFNHIGY